MGGSSLVSDHTALALNGLPPRLSIDRGHVHVWTVGMRESDDEPALMPLLSRDERRRAGRFAFEPDRRRHVCAHGALRLLLGRYLGKRPADIVYERTAYGKPYLRDEPDVHFNMSHAGDLLLVGVARGIPVGVDVERVRALEYGDEMVRQFFAPEEQALMAAALERDRDRTFFRIWTRKEAVVKAMGTGLATPLNSFAASAASGPDHRGLIRGLPGSWTLRALDPAFGYCAAVAVAAGDATIELHAVML